ncbi:HD domain-containing protein [Streptococcus sp. 10F2]
MTDKKTILEKARTFVFQELAGEASGHDWWHIHRVTQNAITIAKQEGADLFICELAALLHDIADAKFNESEAVGLQIVQNWLTTNGVSASDSEHILHIIQYMSFKGGTQSHVSLSLEGQIVQDADRLDALGAIGIARTMAYSGHFGRPIHDPTRKPREQLSLEEYRNGQDTAIMHFYEKLLKLKDLMNTTHAKKMAQGRHQFLEAYLEQFYAEWAAER